MSTRQGALAVLMVTTLAFVCSCRNQQARPEPEERKPDAELIGHVTAIYCTPVPEMSSKDRVINHRRKEELVRQLQQVVRKKDVHAFRKLMSSDVRDRVSDEQLRTAFSEVREFRQPPSVACRRISEEQIRNFASPTLASVPSVVDVDVMFQGWMVACKEGGFLTLVLCKEGGTWRIMGFGSAEDSSIPGMPSSAKPLEQPDPTYNQAAPATPDARGTSLAEALREAERRMKELEAEGVQWDDCHPAARAEERVRRQD